MEHCSRQELLDFYSRHLEKFGDQPQAVRWTARGQALRYESLVGVAGDLAGKEVLDFGCGKGDLWRFLKSRGVDLRYTGLDVNEKLVAFARKTHPGVEFLCLDIEEEPLDRTFDVVLACGVFNLRIAGIAESMYGSLRRLFPLCREVLHLNIPSTVERARDIDMFYADPGELLSFALDELSPKVDLRHGLVRGEIFLSVHRV